MRKLIVAGLALGVLAGPASAQRPPAPYRALGTEPFWNLEITERTVRLERPDARPLTVPRPAPLIQFNGERYATRAMTVSISHAPCSDGMSDRRYPDTVTVTLGRETLRGCGGVPGAEQSLVDGTWRIERIGGRSAVSRAQPMLTLRDGRVTGTSGCNSLSGTYRFARGRLTLGPLAATKRACVGPAMRQEQTLLRLLGRPLSVTSNRAGKLALSANGQTLVLAPSNGQR